MDTTETYDTNRKVPDGRYILISDVTFAVSYVMAIRVRNNMTTVDRRSASQDLSAVSEMSEGYAGLDQFLERVSVLADSQGQGEQFLKRLLGRFKGDRNAPGCQFDAWRQARKILLIHGL
jgi:hypothetical protein